MQKWIVIIFVAAGTLVSAWGQAERDYTAGFERLFMLGLPDVSEAEYVNLTFHGHRRHLHQDWQWRQLELGGNAWLLETDEEGVSRYLFNDGRIITVYERSHLQRLQREEAEAEGRDRRGQPLDWSDPRLSGTAKPADLAEDVQKALARLQGTSDDDTQRALRQHELDAIGGRMFVFAALTHRHGLQEEATELVNTLFSMAPEPREIILGGLDHMANQQYADLYQAWLEDQQWEAYAVELEELIQRFRTGWLQVPIAEMVRSDLENRLDDSGPPLLDELTEDEQALARALADASSPGMHRQHGFWIFPRSSWQQSFFMRDHLEEHPITQIKAKGLNAVPFLLAMLDDRYPTTMTWDDVATSRTTYGSMRRRTLDEEWTWRLYDSMQRPATRGDVARVLLGQLVREEENQRVSGQTPDQVRAAAEMWWDRFGERSLEEIARTYLEEGLKDQRAAAGLHLMYTDDPADMALVENAITSADDPVDVSELVMNYARVKGPESHELVEPYIEQLRTALEDLEGERAWQRHGVQQVLNNLEALLSDETLETYLAEVMEGEQTFDHSRFMRFVGRSPIRGAVTSMLDALVETDDPELRGGLLMSFFSVQHWRAMSWQLQMGHVDDEEPGPWIVDDFADQWRTLLDSEELIHAYGAGPVLMRNRVAQLFLALLSDQEYAGGHHRAMTRGGAQGKAYYVDWAKERLNDPDKALPPVPTSDDVSEEARAAIAERLLAADESDFESVLNQLSIQEMLALNNVMDEDPALRRHLTTFANRVTWVGPTRESERRELLDNLATNQVINADLVRALLEQVQDEVAADKSLQVSVVRGAGLEQAAVAYGPQSEMALRMMQQAGSEPHVTGHVSVPGRNVTNVRWPLEASAAAPDEDDDELDLFDEMLMELDDHVHRAQDEQREAFWKEVERIANGDVYPHHHGTIYLLGMPTMTDKETP